MKFEVLPSKENAIGTTAILDFFRGRQRFKVL